MQLPVACLNSKLGSPCGRIAELEVAGRGAWVAQSVKRPTLGFRSSHNLRVYEFKPQIGLCTDSAEPPWDSLSVPLSLSLSLSAPPLLRLSLSLSKTNK